MANKIILKINKKCIKNDNLYINDIVKTLPNMKCIIFAEDTNILIQQFQELMAKVSRGIYKLKYWFD